MMVFGPDGDIQIGCGIMVMVMAMCGVTDIITFGQDHIHIMEVFTIHSILSGDIMIRFTMDMDMDMDMDIHMVIIHGGDHTTLGITTVLMAET